MTDSGTLNAITVDVEDWLQSTIDPGLPLTEHFQANTEKMLAAFESRGVKGTFFVLGIAAEKAPELVRAIHAAGHEVQSHGYGHELVTTLTPESFRQDLSRAKGLLEDIVGVEINGYRAPAFSIGLSNLWALDALVETGHTYDSSVFPIMMKRYGVPGSPREPYLLRTPSGATLIEMPVASYRWLGGLRPVGGGGYFRLFPYPVIKGCVRQMNQNGWPATIYMHPYEYNPVEFDRLDYPVPWKTQLHQGLGRANFPKKVDRLLSEFRFGPIRDVLSAVGDLPKHEYRNHNG